MAFTEFYCRASGSNMNGGGLSTGAEPPTTAAYTSTNGNWSTVTNNFTPTDGTTPASSVHVGDYASVYIDGATSPVYYARVTVVAGRDGAITLSSTIVAGTAPVTSATARTIKVGGAWLGPNGAVGIPISFSGMLGGNLQASTTTPVRINFKNDQTYSITAQITPSGSANFECWLEGYTSSAGDGGRATMDGGSSGASYSLITYSSQFVVMKNWLFQNNGSTGNSFGLSFQTRNTLINCVFKNMKGEGCRALAGAVLIDCEAYANNSSNTAALGGFNVSTGGLCIRCIAHDNTGSNNNGFVGQGYFINCIADTNGRNGFAVATGSELWLVNCTSYNNGRSGIGFNASAANVTVYAENCILANNTTYGVELSDAAASASYAVLKNNAYYLNGTAALLQNLSGLDETGAITLSSAPLVDAANGDFRLNTAQTIFPPGRVLQTASSYGNANMLGYPDVGAINDAARRLRGR
jgi:hypothetical protein